MPPPELLILSDSHGVCATDAAAAMARHVVGGMVEGGRNLNGDFYAFDGRDFRFHDPEADRRYRSFLDSLGVTAAAGIPCPVLCTFGGNFHYLSRQEVWDGFRIPNSPLEGRYLSQAAFEAAVRAMISGALAFQADLVGLGLTVSFALPPRRVPVTASRWAFLEIERAVPPMFAALGVGIIDLRSETLDREGTLRSEFAHPDPADDTHGSVAFGAMVVARAIGARDVPTP